jgi:hypothetical protein
MCDRRGTHGKTCGWMLKRRGERLFNKESVVDKRLENRMQKVQGCADKKVVWIKVNRKNGRRTNG